MLLLRLAMPVTTLAIRVLLRFLTIRFIPISRGVHTGGRPGNSPQSYSPPAPRIFTTKMTFQQYFVHNNNNSRSEKQLNTSRMAPNQSQHINVKKFPGGTCPQTPSCSMLMHSLYINTFGRVFPKLHIVYESYKLTTI